MKLNQIPASIRFVLEWILVTEAGLSIPVRWGLRTHWSREEAGGTYTEEDFEIHLLNGSRWAGRVLTHPGTYNTREIEFLSCNLGWTHEGVWALNTSREQWEERERGRPGLYRARCEGILTRMESDLEINNHPLCHALVAEARGLMAAWMRAGWDPAYGTKWLPSRVATLEGLMARQRSWKIGAPSMAKI